MYYYSHFTVEEMEALYAKDYTVIKWSQPRSFMNLGQWDNYGYWVTSHLLDSKNKSFLPLNI